MAARISLAQLRSNPARTITAAQYDPEKHRGDVLCPFVRCRCELQGVQASTRNVNGEQVQVDAFFRLPSNAEKNGHGHTLGCRFNTGRTVKRLVAMSQEIRNLGGAAELLLDAAPRKGAEFRLHILMEYLPSLKQGWGSLEADATAGSRTRVGTGYVRSLRHAKPYLRVAKAVLAFISRVQKHSELAEWIKLKYGSGSIPWNEYFFDRDNYLELYKHLQSHGQFYRKPGKNRPVALALNTYQFRPRVVDGRTCGVMKAQS